MITAELLLPCGRTCLFDEKDKGLVASRAWHSSRCSNRRGNTYYVDSNAWVVTSQGKQCVTTRLHRLMLGVDGHMRVDHINGNGLDNRRCNLRICTQAQNMQNRTGPAPASGFRGAYRVGKFFESIITINNERLSLGKFATPEEANAVYVAASLKLHGDFSYYRRNT